MNTITNSTIGSTITTATLGVLAAATIFTAPSLLWNALQLINTI